MDNENKSDKPFIDTSVDACRFASGLLTGHTINADQILGGYLDCSRRKLGGHAPH
ncbi:MAG: hypothetical protein H8D75_02400 [Rhodospirillaceae bacterium]|nr:hypothetical protein [Rhodospirillaceae bacterium]MBL6931312.1 hypothetical protein [Rhodospirillales bacterium]